MAVIGHHTRESDVDTERLKTNGTANNRDYLQSMKEI